MANWMSMTRSRSTAMPSAMGKKIPAPSANTQPGKVSSRPLTVPDARYGTMPSAIPTLIATMGAAIPSRTQRSRARAGSSAPRYDHTSTSTASSRTGTNTLGTSATRPSW